MKHLLTSLLLVIVVSGKAQDCKKDIQEYQKQCYNDSSYIEYVYRCTMIGCTVYHGDLPQIIREWKHKEPTFEGFTNYLELKYK